MNLTFWNWYGANYRTQGSRSNKKLFKPYDTASPHESLTSHISGLGPLGRLDFERYSVAEEVIYTVDGDWMPTSQEDEESRIATLAHAIKKLGNPEDAAEYIRCFNLICEGYNARCRQLAASYYYGEIHEHGAGPVLKEMADIGMQLASLNPITEEEESDCEIYLIPGGPSRGESKPRSLFDQEVAKIERMIRGRRKCANLVHDEWTDLFNYLEDNDVTVDEFYEKFKHLEAMDQYDEGGAIVRMSRHERVYARGSVNHEFTVDDLPFELERPDPSDNKEWEVKFKKHTRHLASDLLRAYASGVEIDEFWDEINAELDILFPVKVSSPEGGKFFSRANIELQRLTREILEELLEECFGDYHLTALRKSRLYRQFYGQIRRATDTTTVGQVMQQAHEARKAHLITVKNLTALKTAANNQRERLLLASLSTTAYRLIQEIMTASEKKLGYLGRAMYGENEPSHPIHSLNSQERQRVWEFHTLRKGAILLPQIYARLCATWGRALPLALFVLPAGFRELLELPRVRKALCVVLNKQRPSTAVSNRATPKSIPPSPPAFPIRGAATMKNATATHLCPPAGSPIK